MCGIAGFSIPMNSKQNARQMAHALLTQIENRGSHASGFAYVGADGATGIYKNPKPGSQLSLAELPRDAKTVVLHTRFATQGAVEDNRNNHPVLSTDNTLALVHNGVISNDHLLRAELGIDARHGEVDSLVIPSLIKQQGVSSLSKLSGYAAIAWIDTSEKGELHIARLKSSPVSYTHLIDGSFVFASTATLLTKALDKIDAFYGGVFDMAEQTLMSVHHGFIYEYGRSPAMSYSHSAYARYSGATSGGHGTTQTHNVTTLRPKGSEDKPKVTFTPEDDDEDSCQVNIDQYYEDLEKWRETQADNDLAIVNRAIAMMPLSGMTDEDWDYSDLDDAAPKSPDDMTPDEWDEWVQRHEEQEIEMMTSSYGEGFYILDGEGDISHYPDLDALERKLHWLTQMTRNEFDIFPALDDKVYWANYIMDIGSVGKNGVLTSWIDEPEDIDDYESPAVRNLEYIREGVGKLELLKGA